MPGPPVAALALPEFAAIARRLSRRQRSRVTSTGAACTPEAVKRIALVVSGRSETTQADVLAAVVLDPGGDARGAEAQRQPALDDLADVVGRVHPAGAEERAHRRPAVSSRPNIRLRFCTACDAAPFHRLSITAKTNTLPVRSSRVAWIRQ